MLNLTLKEILIRVITLVVALSFHEFAHAFVANALGDDTPRANGRLSLNPLRHLDLFGSLMMILVGFGWAKPVPVNPYTLQRRTPLGMMLVSLAGPFSNFLLAILAAIPVRANWITMVRSGSNLYPSFAEFLVEFIIINLALMLFNLIPIAPLDGEKVLFSVIPESWARTLEPISRFGPIILMALMFALPAIGVDVIGTVLSPAINNLYYLLTGG